MSDEKPESSEPVELAATGGTGKTTAPPPLPPDGMLRYSEPHQSEIMRIMHFIDERRFNRGFVLNEINFEFELGTSSFAVSAMLKGLEEFYFKPASMQAIDPEVSRITNANLHTWAQRNAKKKSGLIIL